jgi:deoxycytidylate deaminase
MHGQIELVVPTNLNDTIWFDVDMTEDVPDPQVGLVPYRPDLVFGLVVPVGTPTDRLRASLEAGLRSYGYVPEWIRMSDLLRRQSGRVKIQVSDGREALRIESLMQMGDAFCELAKDQAALILEAMVEIGGRRVAKLPGDMEGPTAWIIDSLKRDGEVLQLRHIYGDQAIIVSAHASRPTRRQTLMELIAPKSPSVPDDEMDREIDRLLARDLDSDTLYGQNILDTYPMADCFLNCDQAADGTWQVSDEVSRLLDLLFGNPSASIPGIDEYGMYLATTAAARSPELGRKVGAAILKGQSVVSLGSNTHPMTPTLSPDYDHSKVDLSRLVLDTIERLDDSGILNDDSRVEFVADKDLFVQRLLANALNGSQIADLTEFQVPVHAEMAAILDALAQGKTVSDGTIFVTAYPCHGCARHILRSQMDVVYLDPYPKSRAAAMYGRDVADNFRGLIGVAPRRYQQWFGASSKRSAADGSRLHWGHAEKLSAEPRVTFLEREIVVQREKTAANRSVGAGEEDPTKPGVSEPNG